MRTSSTSRIVVVALALIIVAGAMAQPATQNWMAKLKQELPRLGDRNWVCIVDSAYPLQISPGIETICTGGHQLDVVKAVLAELAKQKHVRPVVYLDKELTFVPEADAPGISAYRAKLKAVLGNRATTPQLHIDTIHMLGDAAKTFKVVILKTDLTLPYTSVFLRLNCGYWSDAAEQRMRDAMKAAGQDK